MAASPRADTWPRSGGHRCWYTDERRIVVLRVVKAQACRRGEHVSAGGNPPDGRDDRAFRRGQRCHHHYRRDAEADDVHQAVELASCAALPFGSHERACEATVERVL